MVHYLVDGTIYFSFMFRNTMKKEISTILIDGLKEQITSYIDLIPVAGVFINQALDVRGKIKQERLLNFLEVFVQYSQDLKDDDVNLDEIQKEEFGDFFEELMIKISKTSSKEKLKIFSKLLKEQLTSPIEIEKVQIMLEIISTLSSGHIHLLHFYKKYDPTDSQRPFLIKNIILNSGETVDVDKFINVPLKPYLLNDLENKGLIKHENISDEELYNFLITDFGIEFYRFIEIN